MLIKLKENFVVKNQLANILMVGLLIIICFPAYYPEFNKGIDESLVWAYNHLFANDFSKASALLFPHGPLAFVMYPLPIGQNLIYAAFFDSLLKCLIFYCLQSYSISRDSNSKLNAFVLCLLLFHLLNVQMLIIAAILSLLMLYFDSSKKIYALIALVLSALALYIKSYVGIICGLIAVSFILADFIRLRMIKSTLLFAVVFTLSYPLIWFLMFGSFANFFTYIYGVKELASDNSAAAAFYPENNWIYLSLAIALFVSIPIFNRTKKIIFFYAITALAIFAAWKHGMARQDIYHTRGLFFLLLVFYTLLNFFNERFNRSTLLVSLGSLVFFSLNLPNVRLYEENNLSFFRVNRFAEFVFDHQKFKDYHLQNSYKNIENQKLDSSLLNLIANNTIDVYPWDYSYIAANKFNWQPRPVLHSYAAYSSWLDTKDSQHFRSVKAPKFIIFEIDKKTEDLFGGSLESIDQRYLLNDEPKTILAILENYRIVHKNNRFILFEKRETPIVFKSKSLGKFNTRFGEDLSIPEKSKNGILRLKTKISKTIKGRVQSFLFKDQESFINYYMNNGDVYRYKIVPKNAADGIWVNPMLMHPENNSEEPGCLKIMFSSSDPSFYNEEIICEWEILEEQSFSKPLIFNKKAPHAKNKILEQVVLEKKSSIDEKGFSASFQISIDSLIQLSSGETFELKSNLWTSYTSDAILVITIDDAQKKNLFWEGFELNRFSLMKNEMNPANFVKSFDNLEVFKGKNAVLSVYVWNKGNSVLDISDFRLSIWTN
jgi:hypothetical protein